MNADLKYWMARAAIAEETLKNVSNEIQIRDDALNHLHEIAESYEIAVEQLMGYIVLISFLRTRR